MSFPAFPNRISESRLTNTIPPTLLAGPSLAGRDGWNKSGHLTEIAPGCRARRTIFQSTYGGLDIHWRLSIVPLSSAVGAAVDGEVTKSYKDEYLGVDILTFYWGSDKLDEGKDEL
uniref:Uncharacterized protein n=1 Tax=Bionectria ochroleuca TaxID=29856 RepID=A0A8H7N4W1_BIOOC